MGENLMKTPVNSTTAAKLERIADELESNARYGFSKDDPDRNRLFAIAWDIKQIARRSTPSEGI